MSFSHPVAHAKPRREQKETDPAKTQQQSPLSAKPGQQRPSRGGKGRNQRGKSQFRNARGKKREIKGLPEDLGAGDNAPVETSGIIPENVDVAVENIAADLGRSAVVKPETPAEAVQPAASTVPESQVEQTPPKPAEAAPEPVAVAPAPVPAAPAPAPTAAPAPGAKAKRAKREARVTEAPAATPPVAEAEKEKAPVPQPQPPQAQPQPPAEAQRPQPPQPKEPQVQSRPQVQQPQQPQLQPQARPQQPQPQQQPRKVPEGGVPASEAPQNPKQWARGPQGNPIVEVYRPPVPQNLPEIFLKDLQSKTVVELLAYLPNLSAEEASNIQKHQIIVQIIRNYLRQGGMVITSGVLEIMPDGYGFLRSPKSNYLQCPEDVFVSPSQVRRFALRTGDLVQGIVREPRDKERFFALARVDTVNGKPAAEARRTTHFEDLTPLFPTRRIRLESKPEELSMRIMDIFTPVGFGQRGLIVAPPRTGKTVLMQKMANAISENHPDAVLIILLIDERPEEVTDMQRNTKAQVISSTFDEAPERHIQVAEMVIEMAKRQVENGKDVVILLDSITRLARAYNTVQPHSGRVLTGGVDANALHKPKRFFGAARNIENGGSLTIISTALIETGSRMDEVIFEEFKGTGNMELNLDREISDKRIYPAINIEKSGTRKEELLLYPEELNRTWMLRRALTGVPSVDAIEMVLRRIKPTKSNAEFLLGIKEG
ncbi:MAG: transcription termination factor Rho [Kiritimatiellae bacterium]|nr:transcription termination factor Rho [Kiritimatiellia bacterium]